MDAVVRSAHRHAGDSHDFQALLESAEVPMGTASPLAMAEGTLEESEGMFAVTY